MIDELSRAVERLSKLKPRQSPEDQIVQLRDALSGLLDWVKEGCPDGGRYAIIEAEAALKSIRIVRDTI